MTLQKIPSPVSSSGGKHLTFTIGGETYGLSISNVIQIIDMHAAFGLARAADTERTCIVVVQTGGDGHFVALVVETRFPKSSK